MSNVTEIVITKNRQDIEVYQKNTLYITVTLTDNNDNNYHLENGDKLIFGVKKIQSNPNYTIKKVLTLADEINDGYTFCLTADNMSISPGRYIYDIALQFADGDFKTIVHPSRFVVIGVICGKE